MSRPGRLLGTAMAGWLVACSGATVSAPVAREPAAAAPPPPHQVGVEEVLGRAPDEGTVLLRLGVARQHPLGARLVPFIMAWPGWDGTLAALTSQPLTDLDWIEVVGPKDPAHERLLTRTAIADDVIDGRLQSRGDGSLRVVERPQSHLVVALPPDGAQPVVTTLRSARLTEPDASDPDEVLHVDFPHPHGVILYVPEETQRARVRVDSRPGGAAEGFADLVYDDAATAAHIAARLRARAEQMNNLMVRVLTRDLLGALEISVEGAVVKLRLPATREQLESLATLAAALLPAGTRQ